MHAFQNGIAIRNDFWHTGHVLKFASYRITGIALLWLALCLPAFGRSTEISVTPRSLNQSAFLFSVTNEPATNGLAFHVTITAKNPPILPESIVNLASASSSDDGRSRQISPEQPEPSVTLTKSDRVWLADIIVPKELMADTNLCLLFSVPVYAVFQDGKRMRMPSGELYEIKLRDFVRK